MLHNYHTHTFRNHHAVGTEREYIEAAIAGGYQTLGFSERRISFQTASSPIFTCSRRIWRTIFRRFLR